MVGDTEEGRIAVLAVSLSVCGAFQELTTRVSDLVAHGPRSIKNSPPLLHEQLKKRRGSELFYSYVRRSFFDSPLPRLRRTQASSPTLAPIEQNHLPLA